MADESVSRTNRVHWYLALVIVIAFTVGIWSMSIQPGTPQQRGLTQMAAGLVVVGVSVYGLWRLYND